MSNDNVNEDRFVTLSDGIVYKLHQKWHNRSYHIPVELSKCRDEIYFPIEYWGQEDTDTFGAEATMLVKRLSDIIGIEYIQLSRHSLKVYIGLACDWDNCIHEMILSLLREIYGLSIQISQMRPPEEIISCSTDNLRIRSRQKFQKK